MKKRIGMLLAVVLAFGALTACSGKQTEESKVTEEKQSETETKKQDEVVPVVAALKGPTAMGMVKMMDERSEAYDFSINAAIDEITAQIVKGEVDIAAVPANLASVLYNNTDGEVAVMAVNTLGVLYIVENQENIQSIEDLAGKTIYATGKGATPEYALNHILGKNNLVIGEDVTVEFKAEPAECISALAEDENAIAMLPQPFVTTAQSQNENLRIALDLTAEWDKIEEASTLLTGVVVVRKEFAESNPEIVDQFLDEYQSSVEFINDDVKAGAQLVDAYEIVPAAVAEKAIPYCNITFIEGDQLKEKLGGYLEVLFDQNPQSVGGAMPGEDFYYAR